MSERTARRDLDALGVAGLPVYSMQGRNGGWRLAGGGRTDLSGLTSAEARALFMVAGPASATPGVKAALRKLVRALPEGFRADAEAASGAIHVDPTSWDGPAVRAPAARAPRRDPAGGHRRRAGRARLRRPRPVDDRRAPSTRSGSPPRGRSGTWWRAPTPASARSGSTG